MITKRFNLLFITQKVSFNDDILGVVNQWLEKLSVKVNKLYILCLEKGQVNLPQNCQVFSLGKERGGSCLKYVFNFYRFVIPLIFKKKIDGIFIHMNQIYIFLLLPFWPILKIYNISLIWWKCHGYVNWKMKLASKIVNRVVTASEQSFPIHIKDKIVIGHGIDTDFFNNSGKSYLDDVKKIFWISRISPIKNLETLILAADILVNQEKLDLKFYVVGSVPQNSQLLYLDNIKKMILNLRLKDSIIFLGAVPHRYIPDYYKEADIFVNTSNTKSLDKTVLEAMSCGTIVVNSNVSFKEIFEDYPMCQFKQGNYNQLAENIKSIIKLTPAERENLGRKLREYVVNNHNIESLIDKTINVYAEINSYWY